MRYLGEDEVTQMMGLGYPGEVRQGLDGYLYQWVEGYDGLGNPVGFWKRFKRLARRALPIAKQFIPGAQALKVLRWRPVRGLLRRGLPLAQRFAPFVPGVGPAVAAGLKVAAPVLRQAGVTGYDGLGALYQAPDGSLYQVQGLAEDEELRGLAEDEELRGWGLGALYQAPDGTLYQVQGLAEDEELRGFAEDDELQGFAEDDELRGWGQAEDEELRGFAEDDELQGFAEDDELRGWGLAEDEELQGFAEDEELRGFAEDEELQGFAEDEELQGLAEDEELQGLYGYVREDGVSGLEAFVPDQPAGTPWFSPPAQPPDMWRPLW